MTTPLLPPALAALSQRLNQIQADIALLKRQTRAAQLGSSSVENGTIVFTDESQTPQIMVGLQPDGTFAHVALGTGLPPAPADPLVSAGINGLYAVWDGLMADGSQPLSDFLGVQIHCSAEPEFTPDQTTYQGTLNAAGIFGIAGLTPGTTYFVLLVTVNQAGNISTESDYVSGVPQSPAGAIASGSLTGDQVAEGTLTGANIAADTITALNLVSGIVVAGIVDATEIQTATLISSVILGYAVTPRGPSFFDFEDGTTDGWQSAASCAVTVSTVWASTGTHSLLITAAGGGQPQASSVTGLAAIPVTQFDPVSLRADVFCPAALNHVYIGIQWYDPTGQTLLAENDCTDTVFAAGQQTTLEVSANAPANGFAVFVVGDHASDPGGTLIYADNILASGNMAFSTSAFGGVDSLGNVFDQGIEVNGVNGLLEAFTVQDAWGQAVLAAFDGMGNITGQTISATNDIYLQGISMATELVPSLPQGTIARTNLFASSLPAPGTPTTSEFFLYQLDVQLTAGRSYMLSIEPMTFSLSAQGKVRVTVYATTDGSQPSNSSAVLISTDANYGGANENFTVLSPPVYKEIESSAGALWRFLISANPIGTNTGTGVPTMQLVSTDTNPGDDAASNAQARMVVYDMGPTVPNTGRAILSTSAGSGSGSKNFTKTYQATASYSYQGSNGPSPNKRINTGGSLYQGGTPLDTQTGHAKSWIVFPYTTIASDLSGATINSVILKLNNNKTWLSTGMTVALGWDTRTTFGATLADPAGGSIDILEFHVNQGQALSFPIGTTFGNAFKSSSATSLVLFTTSSNLAYFGYFSGAAQLSPPTLTINYTK